MRRCQLTSAPSVFSSCARWASCAPVQKTCFSLPSTKCSTLSNLTMRQLNISAHSPRLRAPRSLTTASLIISRWIRCLSKISYSTSMSDKKRSRKLRANKRKTVRNNLSKTYLKYWREKTKRWLKLEANRVLFKAVSIYKIVSQAAKQQ